MFSGKRHACGRSVSLFSQEGTFRKGSGEFPEQIPAKWGPLLVGTAQIAAKTTRDSQGVAVVTLKKNQTIASVVPADTLELANPHRYRVRSLPATGALIRAEDEGEQMSLL